MEIPPDWTFDNDTFVLNRHVDVFVDLGAAGRRVVDFNIGDFKSSYEMRMVSDVRALAQFYNNIGVERMQAGDTASALWCFRRAIVDDDRQFSPAWINLGTLYLRDGHDAHAEAAFLQALDVSDSDLVAMSDLSRLCDRRGDRERAEVYEKRVIHQRRSTPTIATSSPAGRTSPSGTTRPSATSSSRSASDRERMGGIASWACVTGRGDERKARRWLARAEEVAAANVDNLGNSLPSSLPKPASPP